MVEKVIHKVILERHGGAGRGGLIGDSKPGPIHDDGWLKKAIKFDAAMAIGHAHHCNFNALIADPKNPGSPCT